MVESEKCSWIVFWINQSIFTSIAVVSSSINILDFRSKARVKQMSCLWPTEKFSPLTLWSSPLKLSYECLQVSHVQRGPNYIIIKATKWIQVHSKGAREQNWIFRREPENRTGSCGTIWNEFGTKVNQSNLWNVHTINHNLPDADSTIRKRARVRNDFPVQFDQLFQLFLSDPLQRKHLPGSNLVLVGTLLSAIQTWSFHHVASFRELSTLQSFQVPPFQSVSIRWFVLQQKCCFPDQPRNGPEELDN